MEKKSLVKKFTGSREALLAVVLIVLFIVITAINPAFLTTKSLMDMLKNNAVTMVMALGMLCVMLVGGIDISIMSTLALSGMSIGMLLKNDKITGTPLVFLIAVGIGMICGLVVGLVISRADVPPIIATMGFMYVFRARGYLVSNGGEWASAAALGDFKNFATGTFLGLNHVIWVVILCYAFFFWFMKWTRTGRMIYAVGSNASAAEVSGINVKNIKLLVYVIMGLLAGLGGALQVSVYASAMPDMQYGGEMDVIAACVIGGVSMNGGRGSVLGALFGSLILATIAKALPLIPFFDQLWLNTIKGLIILIVVVMNVVLQRVADKNALKGREM
ncbi:ABC transporter permease [Blautia sp. XA-2221]|uniref:ABC transporter permease n=1 Tax=Blautia sp. XA-2221 TaxID=2903961 RepID=UPI002378264E|nr:ABC transporter permease [Blautia sp. XA-2221]